VVQIAVRMRTYHELNLRFGKPNFSCRFHWACYLLSRFFVAFAPMRDLLPWAKELFVWAMSWWLAQAAQRLWLRR
jgi:hypothetical protein